MKIQSKYLIGISVVLILLCYFIYTKPSTLYICKNAPQVEIAHISISDPFREPPLEYTNELYAITDTDQLQGLLGFLNNYSFKAKPHIPNQSVASHTSPIIRILFHYKAPNGEFDIDSLQVCGDGSIYISEAITDSDRPYTLKGYGLKAEKEFYTKLYEQIVPLIQKTSPIQ